MIRRVLVPVLIVATLFAPSSIAGAITTRAASAQYVNDVAPANAALTSFTTEVNAWTNATPDAEGEREAASVLTALGTLQKKMLSQTWPPMVEGGVVFIVREDISSLDEDLDSISDNSSLGNGAFKLTWDADSKTVAWHAFYVRRDLGLPSSRVL